MNQLYKVIGISKQAVSQYQRSQEGFDAQVCELIAEAEALRKIHPGCGVEKMYYCLNPCFIGRDRFIDIMMAVGLRLKKPRNYRRTTYAGKIHYPNLIKGLRIRAPGRVWQSDITYLSMGDQFYYAVFIIDIYSKKIVGHCLSRTLHARANVQALKQACKQHGSPGIHHSDRGSQYSSHQYISLLKSQKVAISMGQKAQENAFAERINRTIKEEYLDCWKAQNYTQLKRHLQAAVKHYNEKRPHNHLNRMSPVVFERRCSDTTFKKPTITIFDDNNF